MSPFEHFSMIRSLSCGVMKAQQGYVYRFLVTMGWVLGGFFILNSYPFLENKIRFLKLNLAINKILIFCIHVFSFLWCVFLARRFTLIGLMIPILGYICSQ